MKRSSWTSYVSGRWYRRGASSGMSLVPATAGIAVGVAALIVVIGVMNGFQMGFIDTVLEMDSHHLRVSVAGDPFAAADRIAALPGVRSAMPFADTRTLATGPYGRSEPLKLKLIPEDAFERDPVLARFLGGLDIGRADGLILGELAARSLNVAAGDSLDLLDLRQEEGRGLRTETIRVRVAAVFSSSYYDFDASLAFVPPGAAAAIGRDESWLVGVKLKDRYGDARAAAQILEAFGPQAGVESWRSYNRSFFGALRMEKSIMLLLVGLIFLVVGVNIFHALRKAVFARMAEIAVLKAMGGSSAQIRLAFMRIGLVVGAGGAGLGLILGLAIAMNVNGVFRAVELALGFLAWLLGRAGESFRFFSPDFFYVSEVPVRLPFAETLFIGLAGALSALFAAWAASSRVSRCKPSEVLRDE